MGRSGIYESFEYRVDLSQPVDSKLLCRTCNYEFNPCFNFATCDDSTGKCFTTCDDSAGRCECNDLGMGYLCEYVRGCDMKGVECKNKSICQADGTCACNQGSYGKLCQYEFNFGHPKNIFEE